MVYVAPPCKRCLDATVDKYHSRLHASVFLYNIYIIITTIFGFVFFQPGRNAWPRLNRSSVQRTNPIQYRDRGSSFQETQRASQQNSGIGIIVQWPPRSRTVGTGTFLCRRTAVRTRRAASKSHNRSRHAVSGNTGDIRVCSSCVRARIAARLRAQLHGSRPEGHRTSILEHHVDVDDDLCVVVKVCNFVFILSVYARCIYAYVMDSSV